MTLGDMVSVCAGRGLGSGLMIRGLFPALVFCDSVRCSAPVQWALPPSRNTPDRQLR